MSDYTKTTNFSAKDALLTGDPNKLIKGSNFDTEFDNLATSSATKFDSGDIATEAQAKALASNVVLITPLRVATILGDNAGMLADILVLADPTVDTLLGWDDSAKAILNLTLGSGAALVGTALVIDHDGAINFVADEHINHSGVSVTAGSALSGGGTIAATRTINVDLSGLTQADATDIDGADEFLLRDGSTNKAVRWQDFGVPQTNDTTTTPLSGVNLTFANRIYNCSNAAAIGAVIPANSAIAFPIGTILGFFQQGDGQVTVSVTTDTLEAPAGAKTSAKFATVYARKRAATVWVMSGDTAV